MSLFSRIRERTLALSLFAFSIAGWITAQSPHASYDDSFYYLKIAQNIAAGNGSTFDGIHWTNGYHPLWLGCLVVIFWIAPMLETAALIARLVQGVVFAVSAGLVYALARNFFGRGAAILTGLGWILFTFHEALDGMEYGIDALGIITTAVVYVRWFTSPAKAAMHQYVFLGIIAALTILARLDGVLLALCLGIFLLSAEWRAGFTQSSAARLFSFAAPIAFTCATYAGVNQMIFGVPVPVSGIAKHIWSESYVLEDPAFAAGGWLAVKFNLLLIPFQAIWQLRHLSWLLFPMLIVLGVYGATLAWLVESRSTPVSSHKYGFRALAPFVLFSALSYLSDMILFQNWIAYAPWYFVIQPMLTALLIGTIASLFSGERIRRRSVLKWQTPFGMAAGAAITTYILWSISFPFAPSTSSQIDPLEQAARWLKTNTPAHATIGAWNSGIIGYYSQRRVINLDGLVNSWDYLAREQYDLCDYWQKNHIAFLADYFEGVHALGPMPVYPYYKKCADQMELVWSDETSDRSQRVKIYRLDLR